MSSIFIKYGIMAQVGEEEQLYDVTLAGSVPYTDDSATFEYSTDDGETWTSYNSGQNISSVVEGIEQIKFRISASYPSREEFFLVI